MNLDFCPKCGNQYMVAAFKGITYYNCPTCAYTIKVTGEDKKGKK